MRKLRTYDSDFKANAVRLAQESNVTQTQLSLELGISQSLLSRWIRESRRRTNDD